jgi:hypothetical protein
VPALPAVLAVPAVPGELESAPELLQPQ